MLGINVFILYSCKKYPKTFIYANQAEFQNNDPELNRTLAIPEGSIKKPVFITQFADIAFIGFDIDKDAAKGNLDDTGNPPIALDPGYFFVFKEIVGEVNFGLDVGWPIAPTENEPYEDLESIDWISIIEQFINLAEDEVYVQPTIPSSPVNWGSNAADMAYITYRRPTMVAFHALNLIVWD